MCADVQYVLTTTPIQKNASVIIANSQRVVALHQLHAVIGVKPIIFFVKLILTSIAFGIAPHPPVLLFLPVVKIMTGMIANLLVVFI